MYCISIYNWKQPDMHRGSCLYILYTLYIYCIHIYTYICYTLHIFIYNWKQSSMYRGSCLYILHTLYIYCIHIYIHICAIHCIYSFIIENSWACIKVNAYIYITYIIMYIYNMCYVYHIYIYNWKQSSIYRGSLYIFCTYVHYIHIPSVWLTLSHSRRVRGGP